MINEILTATVWSDDLLYGLPPGVREHFVFDCAERALTREREAGREPDHPDSRLWKAVQTARQFAKGKASKAELKAAAQSAQAAQAASSAAAWKAAALKAAWKAASSAAAWKAASSAAAWKAASSAAWTSSAQAAYWAAAYWAAAQAAYWDAAQMADSSDSSASSASSAHLEAAWKKAYAQERAWQLTHLQALYREWQSHQASLLALLLARKEAIERSTDKAKEVYEEVLF